MSDMAEISMCRILKKTRPSSFPDLETAAAMRGIATESRAKIGAYAEEFLEPAMAAVSDLIRERAGDGFHFCEVREGTIREFSLIAAGGMASRRDILAGMIGEKLEGMGFNVSIKSGAPGAALPMVVSWFPGPHPLAGRSEGVAQDVGPPAV